MGYTIVHGSGESKEKRIHPGVKTPTFKTKKQAIKWLNYQRKGFTVKQFGKVKIVKTKKSRRRQQYGLNMGLPRVW